MITMYLSNNISTRLLKNYTYSDTFKKHRLKYKSQVMLVTLDVSNCTSSVLIQRPE